MIIGGANKNASWQSYTDDSESEFEIVIPEIIVTLMT